MKIAFIITVYKNDKLHFFTQAIESIMNQDYGFDNINIYLGIDGKLPYNITKYIEENNKYFYKLVYNEQNMGLSYTLNRLIEVLGNEKYIFRMDSDDICKLDRVSKQLKAFDNDKSLIILGTNLIEINEYGKELRKKSMPTNYEVIKEYSIARNPLNHPTVAIKKEFFSMVGTYNEKILKSQDYELWARALKKDIKISNLNEPLLYFRITSDYINKRNSFSNSINEFKISIDLMIYFKMYRKFPMILAKLIARLLPSFIGSYLYKKSRGVI